MSSRRRILYVILIALSVILIYNLVFSPLLLQQNWQGQMGMHSRMRTYDNSYTFNFYFKIILVAVIIIAGFILLDMILTQSNGKNCVKCGNALESERWIICPNCGTVIPKRGDNK